MGALTTFSLVCITVPDEQVHPSDSEIAHSLFDFVERRALESTSSLMAYYGDYDWRHGCARSVSCKFEAPR